MKRIILATSVMVIIFSGCANKKVVSYDVTSVPSGAKVDVNDMYMGTTPTEIQLECIKRWVGVMNAPGGFANATGPYKIKAYPTTSQGISQTKNIDPCQWAGEGKGTIQFDLNLETVTPTNNHNINLNSGNSKLQEKLNALKTLRDSGIISDSEYKEKSLQLLK